MRHDIKHEADGLSAISLVLELDHQAISSPRNRNQLSEAL